MNSSIPLNDLMLTDEEIQEVKLTDFKITDKHSLERAICQRQLKKVRDHDAKTPFDFAQGKPEKLREEVARWLLREATGCDWDDSPEIWQYIYQSKADAILALVSESEGKSEEVKGE